MKKVGDKVWTWDIWYNLIQIEIETIEDMDRTDVVNFQYPIELLSYTKEGAEAKMKTFILGQIEVKKRDIKYLKGKLKGI